ncbi:MAG: FHA domain-containing protein, partial [Geminicoccaceae bacterium]|nr:FHA domain-containing protein [Geminicoccaceae bacterium]
MRLKIRTLQRLKSGGTSASDHVVEVPEKRIGIGRGTDNEVFLRDLRVNYKHARILVRDFDTIIEAEDDSLIQVDEVPVERAVIDTNSEIDVGPYRLKLLGPEGDDDLVITVELVSPVESETVDKLIRPERTKLEGRAIGRRSLAWSLFLLVLALTLALPILAHLVSDPERAERTVTAE